MTYFLPAAMFIIGITTFFFSIFYMYEEDPNLIKLNHMNGKMTKLEYDNHTYIGWACNCGCSMVHDPNCKCRQ